MMMSKKASCMIRGLLQIFVVACVLCISAAGIAETGGNPEDRIRMEDLKQATEALHVAVERIRAVLQSGKDPDILAVDDCITARFLGFDELPDRCFFVALEITNRTGKKIVITLDDASVNDESMPMVLTGMPVHILPGRTGRGSFAFLYHQSNIKSLSMVHEVKFRINVLDESMHSIEKTAFVSVMNPSGRDE